MHTTLLQHIRSFIVGVTDFSIIPRQLISSGTQKVYIPITKLNSKQKFVCNCYDKVCLIWTSMLSPLLYPVFSFPLSKTNFNMLLVLFAGMSEIHVYVLVVGMTSALNFIYIYIQCIFWL